MKSRGLQVTDDTAAKECLRRNGYYRLSGYWYPFRKIVNRKPTNEFLDNSRFDDAIELYKFDKRLKLLLLDAIERVEIAARVEVAAVLGSRNPFAHMDAYMFRPTFTRSNRGKPSVYQEWSAKFKKLYLGSNAEFILHHKREHGPASPVPIWVAIELWDFGMLSYAFSGMEYRDQSAVATRFSVPDWEVLESWIQRLNFVRNAIAHHSRLWNSNLGRPKLPPLGVIPDFDTLLSLPAAHTRVYSICCILCYLTRIINPQSLWIGEMKILMNDFPIMPHANIQDMGFPTDWQSHALWK